MRLPRSACLRPGFALLEVLLALAIFLISMIAIGQLITQSGDRALEIQRRSQATRLCQSKMAEVMAGVVSLTSQSDASFDEDSDWTWSLTCTQSNVAGLWSVEVRVRHQDQEKNPVEEVLTQMITDPSIRGSNMDVSASSSSSSSSSGGGASSGGNPSSSGSPSGAGGAAKGGASMGSKSSSSTTPTPKAPASPGTTKTPSSGSPTPKTPAPSGTNKTPSAGGGKVP